MGIGFCIQDDEKKVNAHWSYCGFFRFRKRICDLLGGTYGELIDGSVYKEFFVFDCDFYEFLNHPDCTGVFHPESCKRIYPKIKDVLNKFDGHDFQDSYDKIQGMNLVEAMKYCAENKKILQVC